MLDEKCTQQLKTAVIDRILNELSKPEYVNKIHDKILDPLIQYTFDRLYPYILITTISFAAIFIVAILILYLIIRSKK